LTGNKSIWPVKKFSDEVLAWLSVRSVVQMTSSGPADATATPSSVIQKNPEWFVLLTPAYPGFLEKGR